jgi:hypothetical protein
LRRLRLSSNSSTPPALPAGSPSRRRGLLRSGPRLALVELVWVPGGATTPRLLSRARSIRLPGRSASSLALLPVWGLARAGPLSAGRPCLRGRLLSPLRPSLRGSLLRRTSSSLRGRLLTPGRASWRGRLTPPLRSGPRGALSSAAGRLSLVALCFPFLFLRLVAPTPAALLFLRQAETRE